SRLAFWAWVVGLFELFRLLGVWPHGVARPIPPSSSLAHDWSARGLLALGVLAVLGWLVARERLLPRRAITLEEDLAGHTASLLVVWLAGTGQLAALAARRYAPYPAAAELPPTGPLRRVVRGTVLAVRNRRRPGTASTVPEALEG